MSMHTSPSPRVQDQIPSQGSPLSPEWIHAITTLMGNPLSSETGYYMEEWILYHEDHDLTDVCSPGTPLTLMILDYFKIM